MKTLLTTWNKKPARLILALTSIIISGCSSEKDNATPTGTSPTSQSTDFIPPISNCWVDTTSLTGIVFFSTIDNKGNFIGNYPCSGTGNLFGSAKNFSISFKVLTSSTSVNEYSGRYLDTSSAHPLIRLFRPAEGDTILIRPS